MFMFFLCIARSMVFIIIIVGFYALSLCLLYPYSLFTFLLGFFLCYVHFFFGMLLGSCFSFALLLCFSFSSMLC